MAERGANILAVGSVLAGGRDGPFQAHDIDGLITNAANGSEALELAQEQSFDLVLSDVLMHGMSGYELCRRLKSGRSTAGLPVALVISLHSPDERLFAEGAGTDFVLSKPFRRDELLSCLRSANGNGQAGGRTAHPNYPSEEHPRADELAARESCHGKKMRAVERLAGGVSHDLNDLLMVIRGFAQVLQSNLGPDEKNGRYLSGILDAALQASELSDQLLLMSSHLAANFELIDLAPVLDGLALEVRSRIGDSIALDFDCPRNIGRIRGDHDLLREMLMRLVENAVDAMPNGGTLSVGAVRTTLPSLRPEGRDAEGTGKETIVLDVRDTGRGMGPEIAEHAFEPYFSTKDKGKGSGNGLAAVHGIVSQLQGRITSVSVHGEGTLFRIVLPLPSGERLEGERGKRKHS